MLENKQVILGDRIYRLTIEKERQAYAKEPHYIAYLSDINSQFASDKLFYDIESIKGGLMEWLTEAHSNNVGEETKLFDQLRRWNGVVPL